MSFTHLAAFFSVAETGSVTAASERLHVSQPTLTLNSRSAMTFVVNRPGIRSACAGRRGLQAIAWPQRVARQAMQARCYWPLLSVATKAMPCGLSRLLTNGRSAPLRKSSWPT
ncbi:LysR family transcriptional regulator [Caballeronia mineralivorans]|uniref:LysR family transcriptional regulator n=1 Tax=Caballeronia mineralivorans TaxID=2010198 RepID=UPI001F2E6820